MSRFLLVATLLGALAVLGTVPAAAEDPPQTGFEKRAGESWTTHAEEVAFLEAVDAASQRVSMVEIGRTQQDRPLHLVTIGAPAPRPADAALQQPTSLFVCSQHGNEPAGREACLRWLRDLAFTEDKTLVNQLREQTVLFIPTANPDGRAANSRGNASGEDINRDHIDLSSPEAQAIAAVARDWKPDIVVDLHEFGPPVPGLYDDDLLYLWPRNLNVDAAVHDAAKSLAEDYIAEGARANGETAGEYGRYRDPVFDYHVSQSAGDEDDAIARNTFGLRHAAGILLETRVENLAGGPANPANTLLQNRRVNTHYRAVADTLRYMRANGETVAFTSDNAAVRKTREGAEGSAPVYFNGQTDEGTLDGSDNSESTSFADPPPCGYQLDADEVATAGQTMALHGIKAQPADGGAFVSMAQPAEPVIPLLFDARALRNMVEATPLLDCHAHP